MPQLNDAAALAAAAMLANAEQITGELADLHRRLVEWSIPTPDVETDLEPTQPKVTYEWATEHTPQEPAKWTRLWQPTGAGYGPDVGRRLALVRLKTWRADRPDVTSTLWRRTVTTTYGEWEQVDE